MSELAFQQTSHGTIQPVIYTLSGCLLCSRLWCWCATVLTPLLTAGYLSELCIPVASASGHQHLSRSASTGLLQVPRAQTMIGRWSFTVMGPSLWKSSGCSMETGDDTAHFQVTTQGLSVPHLMCRRTEGTSTTARSCCGVFLWFWHWVQKWRLTYLLYAYNLATDPSAWQAVTTADTLSKWWWWRQ